MTNKQHVAEPGVESPGTTGRAIGQLPRWNRAPVLTISGLAGLTPTRDISFAGPRGRPPMTQTRFDEFGPCGRPPAICNALFGARAGGPRAGLFRSLFLPPFARCRKVARGFHPPVAGRQEQQHGHEVAGVRPDSG